MHHRHGAWLGVSSISKTRHELETRHGSRFTCLEARAVGALVYLILARELGKAAQWRLER
ncbi:MAG TPA: hypothetical protein VFQ61_37650 [Polyangiaceae bacterium]|nr:hypothetical protein [Polyangiaceae bacterium]